MHHDRRPDDTRIDRTQLFRLPILLQATTATVAATFAAAATLPDDRQPKTVRRRQTNPRPGVQPDRRAASRVPDTGDHQTRQRVSVSIKFIVVTPSSRGFFSRDIVRRDEYLEI